MKTLVDEIRDIVGEAMTRGVYPAATDAAEDLLGRGCWSEEDEAELFTIIADRIEREYIDLPLDADGVPIKIGDVVYATRYKNVECTVLSIERLSDGWLVEVDNGVGCRFRQTSDDFTHKQPDTLERIEEDARKELWHYWGCIGARCAECPALIDGKTPRDHYHTVSCADAKVLDLLHRQRLVLERGQE